MHGHLNVKHYKNSSFYFLLTINKKIFRTLYLRISFLLVVCFHEQICLQFVYIYLSHDYVKLCHSNWGQTNIYPKQSLNQYSPLGM